MVTLRNAKRDSRISPLVGWPACGEGTCPHVTLSFLRSASLLSQAEPRPHIPVSKPNSGTSGSDCAFDEVVQSNEVMGWALSRRDWCPCRRRGDEDTDTHRR